MYVADPKFGLMPNIVHGLATHIWNEWPLLLT